MNKYEIIMETTPISLAAKVNELIEKGYKPIGGIAIRPGGFMQAVYRKKDKANIEFSKNSGLKICEHHFMIDPQTTSAKASLSFGK